MLGNKPFSPSSVTPLIRFPWQQLKESRNAGGNLDQQR